MPYKNKKKYNKYMQVYRKSLTPIKTAKLLQLKEKFPDAYEMIFGKPRRKK